MLLLLGLGAGVLKENAKMGNIEQIPSLITQIYEIVAKLEYLWPDRRFTPDGHLVGSIGEVLAAHHYDLELLPSSSKVHDAVSKDERKIKVQIKATQRKSVALRSKPEHLLVLFILKDGTTKEMYNGPGELVWENTGKMQKNGQRAITLSRLSKLFELVPESDKLKRVVL